MTEIFKSLDKISISTYDDFVMLIFDGHILLPIKYTLNIYHKVLTNNLNMIISISIPYSTYTSSSTGLPF